MQETAYRKARRYAKTFRRRIFESFGSDLYSRTSGHGVEARLAQLMPQRGGVFIEIGAHDGFVASNTYWLEHFRGWKGILVEANPVLFSRCKFNRPNAFCVHAGAVANAETKSVVIATAGSRGYIVGSFKDPEYEAYHRMVGGRDEPWDGPVMDIEVPARTLESIIDESGFKEIDFFSLDVEGYECQVLQGLNLDRYRPKYLMIEGANTEPLISALKGYYEFVEMITPQDVLYRRRD